MATLNLALDPKRDTKLSLTAFVYSDAGIEQSSVEMTEVGAGVYTGSVSVSGYSDGEYAVLFVTSKRRKGHGKLYVRGGQEVSQYEFELKTEADARQQTLEDNQAGILEAVSGVGDQTGQIQFDANGNVLSNAQNMRGTDGAATPADVINATQA